MPRSQKLASDLVIKQVVYQNNKPLMHVESSCLNMHNEIQSLQHKIMQLKKHNRSTFQHTMHQVHHGEVNRAPSSTSDLEQEPGHWHKAAQHSCLDSILLGTPDKGKAY